jgi:propanol-preferring alcohol dehydrogenase
MATVDIPKMHRAAVRVGSGHDAKAPVKEIETQKPGPDQILVKINWYENRPSDCCV